MDLEVVEVNVYRSAKRADTYVYIPVDGEFENLPEAFRTHFGQAIKILQFHLDVNKTLAQAQAADVLRAIEDQGFYVQLAAVDTDIYSR
ncbi:MAG: YcgL domain-containing protein [Gammaproteobacteria bacterium]|nr:YcgL domain-containing protein [Gammaproteobacteria bacterium]